MAASGWKLAQVVKPHVKMIKFRHGAGAADVTAATSTVTHSAPSGDVSNKSAPVSQIYRDSDVPPRYRRIPMSVEEMEYITRGGPE